MPLPLVKLGIVTVRTFARPFNAVLTRRVRYHANSYEESFFYHFGMKVFAFENKIEEAIANQQDNQGITVVHVDLENVTRGAAVLRGIEVFIELTMFYGLLLSIAFWDIWTRYKDTKTLQQRITNMESEHKKIGDDWQTQKVKFQMRTEEYESNHENINRLKKRVNVLQEHIAKIDKFMTQ